MVDVELEQLELLPVFRCCDALNVQINLAQLLLSLFTQKPVRVGIFSTVSIGVCSVEGLIRRESWLSRMLERRVSVIFCVPYTMEMENNLVSTLVKFYFEICNGIRILPNMSLLPADLSAVSPCYLNTGIEKRGRECVSNEASIMGHRLSQKPHFGDER